MEFGELDRLDLRSVWKNEARDFTPWLADNIGRLGDALGLQLELVEQESGVGDFSLDILAKDLNSGRNVVIENQFHQTNHDHLGKLLTYAGGVDAGTVVWLAEKVRDEHRQALDWLNQRTDSDTEFFAIVVEVLKIGDSLPALQFRPVVFPNEWQKASRKKAKGASSDREKRYLRFFQTLIDRLREEYGFTNARKAQPQSWYSFSSGDRRVQYSSSFALGERARTEITLNSGDKGINKALFDALAEDKEEIEGDYGHSLLWERIDDKKLSRIAVYRSGLITDDQEVLDEITDWMIENLLKMKAVFGPRLADR